MANSKSALKRVRQIKSRTDRNKVLRTRVKSLRKKTLEAAQAVDQAQKKGIYHKNKAANLKSKTVKSVKGTTSS